MTPFVDVVGVGLNATDTVIALLRFPERGGKVEYRESRVLPGGQVASAMVACQGWGLRTRYVGRLGEDEAAALHMREFARLGVEACVRTVRGGVSAQSLILVDAVGERTVLCRRDDRMVLEPGDLQREWVTEARVLLVDGWETAAATAAARWAREAGVTVVGDVDELYPGVEELLGLIDCLLVSRTFPERLTGVCELRPALREMRERFGSRLVGATLGEGGVVVWDGQEFVEARAFQVPVVDTTGAGDVFHAGFCYGLVRGWELGQTLDFACAAAALNCRAVGARGGLGTVEEVCALVRGGERHPAAAF